MHFDRILLNVELRDNMKNMISFFFPFFTVSVNILCFHLMYVNKSKLAYYSS